MRLLLSGSCQVHPGVQTRHACIAPDWSGNVSDLCSVAPGEELKTTQRVPTLAAKISAQGRGPHATGWTRWSVMSQLSGKSVEETVPLPLCAD